MEELDQVLLTALTDRSHAQHREVWRALLQLVLPILLETPAENISLLVENSVRKSIEDLKDTEDVNKLMYRISMELAKAMDVESELGLAAFCDGVSSATRIHGHLRHKGLSSDKLLREWLSRFTLLQDDEDFHLTVLNWKKDLENFLDLSDLADEEELESLDEVG